MDRKTKTEDNHRMKKMKNMKRLAALLLAALLLAACAKNVPGGSEDPGETQPAAAQTAEPGVPETDPAETDPTETDAPATDPAAGVSKAISIVTPASYSDVYKKITEYRQKSGYGRWDNGLAVADGVV